MNDSKLSRKKSSILQHDLSVPKDHSVPLIAFQGFFCIAYLCSPNGTSLIRTGA